MAVTMEMESNYNLLDAEDKHLLMDIFNYRQNSIPELIKRLEKLHSKILNNKHSEDWIQSFIKSVVTCYLQCTEAIKLSRSIFKLIHTWNESHKTCIEEAFEHFLLIVIGEDNNMKSQLVTVSNLLENNEYGPLLVEKHDIAVLTWLDRNISSMLSLSGLSTKQAAELYMYVKITLQLYQFCPTTFVSPVLEKTNQEKSTVSRTLLKHLIHILRKEGYATDCQFLCGTAISLVLLKHHDLDFIITAFWRTYKILGTDKDFSVDNLFIKDTQCEQDQHSKPTIGHIALMKGVLSCGSILMQNGTFVQKCFEEIIKFCNGPISVHYHAFCNLEQFYNKILTSVSSIIIPDMLSTTINTIWLNWDSPVQDVPQIIVRIFSTMLHVWQNLYKLSLCHDIIPDVLSRLHKISWYVKGQYRIISALLPYVDSKQILDTGIRNRLLQCMSTNYLAPSGADVYKSFLLKLRKQEDFMEDWKYQWEDTVITGLTSSNRLQRSNVGHYWIPSTLKIMPEMKNHLIENLTEMMASCLKPRDQLLHAWITVTKVVRLNTGEFPLNKELLKEALYSNDDDIRSEAFSVLCTSLKKADRLKEEEADFLKESLPCNLKIDSAPFRQQLAANVKNLLVRVRDSYNAVSKDKDYATIDVGLSTRKQNADRCLEFVSWFFKLCVDNLIVGACFQRIKMCLDLIQITLEIFYPPKTTMPPLTMEAKQRGLWDMYSYESTLAVLHCVLDGADEIQNIATKLLLDFFPWPLTSPDPCKSTDDLAGILMSSALELCDQPKQHENRSGVLICQIMFVKYMVELNWFISWCYDNGHYQTMSVSKGDNLSSRKFLLSLMSHIHQSFLESQKNPVKASMASPIHGFVSALTICIKELSNRQSSYNIEDIIQQFIDLNCDVALSMMDVMSKEATKDSSPSFAELGQAMESLIVTSETDYSETTTLSSQHQFLLSWCWINIKECCHSLSCLCSVLLKQKHMTDQVSTVEKIKDIFIQVLTKCRHRGVIEGCRSSFIQFIGHLFSSPDVDISSIPRQILDKVLHSFKTSSSSSVTRRSAGMPIILQAIVTVERKYKQTTLLQTSIEELFSLSSEPLPLQYNDQHDLPQVHGLNILNTLFGDSSLSSALMPYTSQAVVLVVTSFGSPAWSIRNAATMLFSSLVMRIFGQKKNCIEEEWRGITLLEFSSLFSELPPLMNTCLDSALEVDINTIDRIKTSLFPVLTLLSNLGPTDYLDDKVYGGLGHKVFKFLSSPVLYLRNLASSAYVALIPLQSLTDTIQFLGQQLPSATTNQQHGLLCCLQKLAMHDIGKHSLSTIKEQLITNCYLCSSPCGIIKSKYLQLLKKLCWESGEDMLNLKDMLNPPNQAMVTIGESFIYEEEIQILLRNCILNGLPILSVIKEYLHMSDIQSSVVCIECLKNNIQHIDREHLTQIQIYLSKLLSDGDIQYPPLLIGTLQVIIDIHHQINSDQNVVSYLYKYWTREIIQTENNVSSLNMVIGAICIDHFIKSKSVVKGEVDKWSERVYTASQMIGAEHFKDAVGNCMKIAGHQIISIAINDEQFHPPAFFIIKSALSLLDDEDCDIRNLVVNFIVSLEWKTKSLLYQSIQFNTGCLMLYDLVVCNFWNSHHVIKCLYEMLYTTGDIQKIFIQRIQQRRQNLFEKEDNNFFSEKIITCGNVYRTLVTIIQKHKETKPILALLDEVTLIKDFEFLTSEIINHLQGNEMMNKLTDGIVLGIIAGLLLATNFLYIIQTKGDNDQYWNSINKIQAVIKNEVLPPTFRNMVSTLMSATS